MAKLRVLILISTLAVVGVIFYILLLYARGYRFSPTEKEFLPSGLLVAKSNPDGAQVFIDGELKNATNTNFTLAPSTYDVEIKKEGYITWAKRLRIEKEEVTEIDAYLFKKSPSLSAITFEGAINPVPSSDFSKIAYAVPATRENITEDKEGLWVIETLNLPLGFSRDPRRITNGNLEKSKWSWSPDGREILLETENGTYSLESSRFTPQAKFTNVSLNLESLLLDWKNKMQKLDSSRTNKYPAEVREVLKNASAIALSPDENVVLYTSGINKALPDEIIKPIPGASSQKQERDIKINHTYTYNIKEDRNFLIFDNNDNLSVGANTPDFFDKRLMWFPSSRHLVLSESGHIIIMDYDGTNRQKVYTGSFISPQAFPTLSDDRLLILTNLGSDSERANFYSLSIK